MKAIVLAGGTGSRLFPSTGAVSKQPLPIYDKPMVYFPLAVVFQVQVKEVLLITTPKDQPAFQRLLADGKQWGVHLQYAIQEQPNGIAKALSIGAEYLAEENIQLILGDNIFYGEGLQHQLNMAKITMEEISNRAIFALAASIAFDDPDLAIPWPLTPEEWILSNKEQNHVEFNEAQYF